MVKPKLSRVAHPRAEEEETGWRLAWATIVSFSQRGLHSKTPSQTADELTGDIKTHMNSFIM